jgi:anti-sigma B factor antagonist
MEFRTDRGPDGCCIVLSGRLDASSADPFLAHVEAEIRMGAEVISLDMSGVGYVSSVGLGALLRLASRMRSGGGQLALVAASDAVTEMLRVTRLDKVFMVGPRSAVVSSRASSAQSVASGPEQAAEVPSLATVPLADGSVLRGEARLLSPEPSTPLMQLGRARGHGTEPIRLSADLVAIGHAALARDAADAAGRYGEAMIFGGVAVVTAASSGRSDFVSIPVGSDPERSARGAESPISASPAAWMLDGLACRGVPRWGAWFEPAADDVSLASVLGAVAGLEDGPCAVVVAGECAGLVGATARTSPDSWDGDVGSHDAAQIKSMLRFCADPVHGGDTAVIVAFVGQPPRTPSAAAAMRGARPLDPADPLSRVVHAHAVAMSFRPISRGSLDAAHTVGSLLAEQRLRSVMHVVQPSRSAMRRGTAWRISLEPPEAGP